MKIVIVHRFGKTPSGPGAPPPAGLKEAGDKADVVIAVDETSAVVVKGKDKIDSVEVFS